MIQPTPHPFTDTSETEAVDILKSLLDHSKVKSDIKERDKHPNIDGYLELVDEFSIPIGKLEVQIKKISDELLNPPRVECKISFLGYCKESQLPVILIGVNIKNKKAYWIHLDNKKVNSYKFKFQVFPLLPET